MVAILALLEGPFGKLIMWGIGLLVFAGVTFGGYMEWKHKVQLEALVEFNAKQAAQAKADNTKFQTQLDTINKNATTIQTTLDKNATDQAARDKAVTDYLDTVKDQPSSDILKETIKRLSTQ